MSRLAKTAQHFQQFRTLRDGSRGVSLRVSDDAVPIQDEGGSSVDAAFFVEYPVGLADRAMRPVVGQKREGQIAQLLVPDFQTGQRVGADLQDFNIQLLERFVVRTEPGYLVLSSTRERKGQERYDRGTATEIGQREFLVGMTVQAEIRSLGTRLQNAHGDLLAVIAAEDRTPQRRAYAPQSIATGRIDRNKRGRR